MRAMESAVIAMNLAVAMMIVDVRYFPAPPTNAPVPRPAPVPVYVPIHV